MNKTAACVAFATFGVISQRLNAQPAGSPSLDFEFFKTRVQPVLLAKRPGQARCVVCHAALPGTKPHPALVPLPPGSDTWDDEASRKNFEEFSRLAVPGLVKSPLLAHHLAPSAGGDALTNGGTFYKSQRDPAWQVLKAWVFGGTVAPRAPGSATRSTAGNKTRLFQTNSAGDNIHIIDPATNKVVGEISGIELSHGIAVAPDGQYIYVSDEAKATLDVVDGKTLKVIKEIPLSARPNNIALRPDGRLLYVGIRHQPGGVDVIDTTSFQKIKTIATNSVVHNPYLTLDGNHLVVGSIEGKTVQVFDAKTDQLEWSIEMGAGIRPLTMSVNPDGSTKWIFVQLSGFNGFAVVDFATRKEVARVQHPALAPGKTEVPSPTEISHGMAVTPDQKTLLICSRINSALYAYSLPDLKVVGTADLGGQGAAWLSLTADGTRAYVAETLTDEVSVVDIKSMKEIARIAVGSVPKRNILGVLP